MDLQRRIVQEEEKYFKNYLAYAKRIKKIAVRLLGDPGVRVIVFGSVVRGEAIPGKSDIDVLIVSDKVPSQASEQAKLRVSILKELGDLAAPFEIHLATCEIYEKWFKKRIGKCIEI